MAAVEGVLRLPTEILMEILLYVEEPANVHSCSSSFYTISNDCYYRFQRWLARGPHLAVWTAVQDGSLDAQRLVTLLKRGAEIPRFFHFVLRCTTPTRPNDPSFSKLIRNLTTLDPATRDNIVSWTAERYHLYRPDSERELVPVSTLDDDQTDFETFFSFAASGRWSTTTSHSVVNLFQKAGYVPLSGIGYGSLAWAICSAFRGEATDQSISAGVGSPLDVLLSQIVVQDLLRCCGEEVRRYILSAALRLGGLRLVCRVLDSGLFCYTKLCPVDVILHLHPSDTSLLPALAYLAEKDHIPLDPVQSCDTILVPWLSDPAFVLRYVPALARLFSYFENRSDISARQLSAKIENAVVNCVRYCLVEGSCPDALWTMYSSFGSRVRQTTLVEVAIALTSLLRDPSPPFSAWFQHANLLSRMSDADTKETIRAIRDAVPLNRGCAFAIFKKCGCPIPLFEVDVVCG